MDAFSRFVADVTASFPTLIFVFLQVLLLLALVLDYGGRSKK